MSDLLSVEGLVKEFPVSAFWGASHVVHAVSGVDLTVAAGEIVAVVGESGSGKSTLGRCILRLARPTRGTIQFEGRDVTHLGAAELAAFRRRVQPVFQDPYSSLDPRWAVSRTIREPLDAFGIGSPAERAASVEKLLDQVGLPRHHANRRPHELSGGQRQRVAIAAALALEPRLVVADEPVSALDLSVQAQILNLFASLRRDLGVAVLFIAHDLAVVEHLADRVAVMYLGRIVEVGPVAQVFHEPKHPYTRALLAAIPKPDPTMRLEPQPLAGEIPSPMAPPPGCRFHPRCPVALQLCASVDPPFTTFSPGHVAACHVAAALHASAVPVATATTA
jgi:oligopeptide/dipeptide ABC transporter ATP-binding protein